MDRQNFSLSGTQSRVNFNVTNGADDDVKYVLKQNKSSKEYKMLKLLNKKYPDLFLEPSKPIMDPISGAVSFRIIQFDHDLEKKKIPQIMHANFAKYMLNAIDALNVEGISNMDIKLRNIVYSKIKGFRMIDFDNYGLISKDEQEHPEGVKTVGYAPPESFLSKWAIGANYDIWSFGVCLYELINGKQPFYTKEFTGPNDYNYRIEIEGIKGFFTSRLQKIKPKVIKEGGIESLMYDCLTINPFLRPIASKLLKKYFSF